MVLFSAGRCGECKLCFIATFIKYMYSCMQWISSYFIVYTFDCSVSKGKLLLRIKYINFNNIFIKTNIKYIREIIPTDTPVYFFEIRVVSGSGIFDQFHHVLVHLSPLVSIKCGYKRWTNVSLKFNLSSFTKILSMHSKS